MRDRRSEAESPRSVEEWLISETSPAAPEPLRWLRLDTLTNAIDNLEMCGYFLRTFPDPIRWKWAILALHQAIYGFAICAVKGTQDTSVLYESQGKSKEQRLISIWKALERARDARYLWPGASPLLITSDEDRALQKLFAEFRNGFEHFQPAGWSIEVSGMPNLFRQAVAVLKRLARDQGSVRYSEQADEKRADAALGVLNTILSPEGSV
jgi:hypothetical protein